MTPAGETSDGRHRYSPARMRVVRCPEVPGVKLPKARFFSGVRQLFSRAPYLLFVGSV